MYALKSKKVSYTILMEGGLSMRINIHDATPASKTPNYIVWMFVGLFVLICSIFAMISFCVVFYANEILGGILIALIPFAFLFAIFIQISF